MRNLSLVTSLGADSVVDAHQGHKRGNVVVTIADAGAYRTTAAR